MNGPRRKRLRRDARLAAAVAWLRSVPNVRVRHYAKWFGVDKYTAHDELVRLGVAIAPGDRHWAVRPPTVPRRRPPDDDRDDPPPGFIEWCGELYLDVGFTAGGAPFGPTFDQMEELVWESALVGAIPEVQTDEGWPDEERSWTDADRPDGEWSDEAWPVDDRVDDAPSSGGIRPPHKRLAGLVLLRPRVLLQWQA
jgi:hypothetical protein